MTTIEAIPALGMAADKGMGLYYPSPPVKSSNRTKIRGRKRRLDVNFPYTILFTVDVSKNMVNWAHRNVFIYRICSIPRVHNKQLVEFKIFNRDSH